MLEILNRYCHGLASIPILLALRERGCLARMVEKFSAEQLAHEFSANHAYLNVALRMLFCLDWIRPDEDGRYLATPALVSSNLIPDGIMDLYRFPFDLYVQGGAKESLAPWLEMSEKRWNIDHTFLADYLDGLIIVPLLLSLRIQGRLTITEEKSGDTVTATLQSDVAPAVRCEIERLFIGRKWGARSGDALHVNRAGRFAFDRIFIAATIASYRPMLSRAQDLMFGDAAGVFARDESGHETHVDRKVNVIASGFQHEKYFTALCDLVVRCFDGENYASQPKYIVDMGCGDGTLLLRLYETVRDRTRRGKVLDAYPLISVGVDFNEKALAETSRTLAAIEHIAVRGDIADPLALVDTLRANGVEDLNRVLHVRSFLDHDRPYRRPEDGKAAQQRGRFGGRGIYINSQGETIPPGEMVQSTVEHLQRWSALVNGHGLIVLETHCLAPQVNAKHLDESESFHFDASQSLSHQFLLEAETFVACAAEAGLFCRPGSWQRFPKNLPFTRISLNHFEKRPYSIRHAQSADLPELLALLVAWPALDMRAETASTNFERALRDFPEGLFILQSDGRMSAAVCCDRERDGAVRLVSACVLPSAPESHLLHLLGFVEQYWALKGDINQVSGIKECRARISATAESKSLAQLVAGDVAAKAVHYPFAPEDDPRRGETELGSFCFRWLLSNLQRMGVMQEPGETFELDQMKRRLKVAPKYDLYFEALIHRLEAEGLVTVAERRLETTPLVRGYALTAVEEQVAEFRKNFEQRYPVCIGLLNFAFACLSHFDELITGQIDVTEVVFKDGAMDLFAEVFKGDTVSDYFNLVIAEAVHSVMVRAGEKTSGSMSDAAARKIRILEIGAGTGGTTSAVLDAIEASAGAVDFCVTDLSPSLVRYARRRFAGRCAWVDYRNLDIEDDLSRQGFTAHHYDVIIAANVLHDTRDVEFTLQQVRSLLQPGGILILNEYTSIKDCLIFSGALLHGYWLFRDPQRRIKDSCLLGVSQWAAALQHSGFSVAGSHALPTQTLDAACSQSVMLCEAVAMECLAEPRVSTPATEEIEQEISSRKTEIIEALIEKHVLALLGEKRASAYSPQRPLMDMGLDSLELVELKSLIKVPLGVNLSPMFLFEHETPEKMAVALAEMVSNERLQGLLLPEPRAQAVSSTQPPAVETPATKTPVLKEKEDSDAIAIIGVSCRFPGGAASAENFWKLLENGRHGIVSMPVGRWQWPASIDLGGNHKGIDKAGFLDRIDEFDAPFFRTSPREAELMDPQQRLLLELSWEAIEDGGHRPFEFSGRSIGVFIGACHGDYREVLTSTSGSSEAYVGTGSACSLLANRLSYFYDLKGPSLTVDTACSSSLFALHHAVTAIRNGDCEQALVGAANLMCAPTNSISYYQAGMLSPTGMCRTFDEAADGYVRGEGAAMLLLKPLATALADGDSIYGLVKGTAVNHGGQAASLTAPKPEAQAAVIEAAWQVADVPLESVGYVETHGTGTRLGDPVEISGLIESFRRLYQARGEMRSVKPHCGLGSVKPNIGHLEGAAGLAGLIKVLMAFQHRSIPATLNFEQLNPDIDLAGSPFYIVGQNQTWPCRKDAQGRELPRRAGVSSFGFGGSNAHAVIEEYPSFTDTEAESGECLVPLSAKNNERLVELAAKLIEFIESGTGSDPISGARLAEVGYTMQVGREPMEERVAFVVRSKAELLVALRAYIAGDRTISNCHRGHVEPRRVKAGSPARDKQKQEIEMSIVSRDLPKLASLWVKGIEFDWTRLYADGTPRRTHVPTYPFAKKRYWLETGSDAGLRTAFGATSVLHPIIDSNVSTLVEQKFTKRLHRDEEFLKSHIVQGLTILPGVAHLEMARAAGQLSLGQPVRVIKNVIFGRAIILEGESKEVIISLRPDGKCVTFEIRSQEDADTVFSRGKIEAEADEKAGQKPLATYDLKAIQQRCCVRKSKSEIFHHLEKLGFDYGVPFQLTDELFSGETEALISLTPCLPDRKDSSACQLDPALMDSALRASFLIGLGQNNYNEKLRIPFSLGKLEVFSSLKKARYAYARVVEAGSSGDYVSNVSILDENGAELLLFENFLAKPIRQNTAKDSILYFRPTWQESSWMPQSVGDFQSDRGDGRILIYGGSEEFSQKLADGLQQRFHVPQERIIFAQPAQAFESFVPNRYHMDLASPDHIRALLASCKDAGQIPAQIIHVSRFSSRVASEDPSTSAQLEQALDQGLLSVTALARELGNSKLAEKVNILFCYPAGDDLVSAAHDCVGGLANALRGVPLGVNVVCVQIDDSMPDPIGMVLNEVKAGSIQREVEIRYQSGKRMVRRLIPCLSTGAESPSSSVLLRKGGTYLITGGMGGLGLLFAQHLASTYHANLVLVGRTMIGADNEEKLATLKKHGGAVHYISADVSRYDDLSAKIAEIRRSVGSFHGIFHAAGVAGQHLLADASTHEMLRTDIAAKIQGTVNLDLVTSQDPLDCFVLFSSLSSYLGDFGRGSYAAANRFLDSFAGVRTTLGEKRLRSGQTISVNWPLWQDGGFGQTFFRDQQAKDLYFSYSGLRAISSEEGLAAFEHACKLREAQLVVAAGDSERIGKVLQVGGNPSSSKPREARTLAGSTLPESRGTAASGTADAPLLEKVTVYLKNKIAKAIKAPATSISLQEPFGSYGIDSIIIMELNRSLEADFESLPGTLFFQFGTVEDLARYFAGNHAARLEAMFGGTGQSAESDSAIVATPRGEAESRFTQAGRFLEFPKDSPAAGKMREASGRSSDIAIIGLSGRYPQAATLERFWENLKLGVDAIEEIPATRWDCRKYYSPDVKQPGKTNSKWGGFIDGVDKFDAAFFNIAPREAHYMDPQVRLFLEIAWEACEDAGHSWERARNLDHLPKENNVGVFVGLMYDDYTLLERQVSTSYWNSFVANRVSHFFNFRGPSMTVDTACSGSLTSIHMACESVRNGDCYAAIAGGTNLSLHPTKYARLSQLNLLSSEGKCRSFGKGGSGYVPGEGVGAVMLKNLDDALRDGDHIYAVIKGGALNHGGKTNGFTVPNPNAQAELITAAIENSGVSPRTISYIEAHGTGTALGDPIEITALTSAFRKHTDDRQFCAIGSVKSNVGHLEGAAGIVALTKVVLQLQHRQLVPSLHSQVTNPLIDFRNSPFALRHELAEWKRPVIEGPDGSREHPRRAGISSFGAGGANAHLILEEFIANDETAAGSSTDSPFLIPISAKTEERLKAYILKYLEFCRREQLNGPRLADMAFTLQTGRQPMEWRAAFIASDFTELCAKMEAFLSGTDASTCYCDHAKQGSELASTFASDEDLKDAVAKWMAKRKLDRLAQLWVKGLEIDWGMMYSDRRPRRVSLPTYPFAGERYWVPEEKEYTSESVPVVAGSAVKILHPLVHENASSFAEQKFVSRFSADSPFVANSQSGQKNISGAIYLEMARAAFLFSSGEGILEMRNLEIENLAVIQSDHRELTISLAPEADAVHFEIYSPGSENESLVHACGELLPGNEYNHSIPALDITAIQARLSSRASQESSDRDGAFEKEALVSFSCGDPVQNGAMWLHPTAVEGAWKAAIAMLAESAQGAFNLCPRCIRLVRLYGQPAFQGYVYAKHRAGSPVADIDLAAPDGRVFLSMRGAEFVAGQSESSAASDSEPSLLTFREEWKPESVTSMPAAMSTLRVVYFVTESNRAESFAAALQAQGVKPEVVRVEQGEAFARQHRTEYRLCFGDAHNYDQLLESLQHDGFHADVIVYRWAEGQELAGIHGIYDLLLAMKRRQGRINRLVLTGSLDGGLSGCYDFSWIGFERSLKLIMPGLALSLVYCEGKPLSDETLAREIWNDGVTRYCDGQRYRLAVTEAEIEAAAQPMLKRNGVYLITGGCGGLGEIFAAHLAKEYEARLVLTGRRTEDESIREKLTRLSGMGAAAVVYHALNVSDGEAMRAGIEDVQTRFGRLDGIIHAAGIGPSRTIFDKDWNEFHAVLQPKIAGSIALNDAVANLDVDFICYFSSSSAFLGDFGSCDYSVANRFQMSYGSYCERKSVNTPRRTKNIVINWPLWREGGMTVGDREKTDMYLRSSGQQYLEQAEGLRIWERLLVSPIEQVLVVAGDAIRIRKFLGRLNASPSPVFNVQTLSVSIEPEDKEVVLNHLSKPEERPTSVEMEQWVTRDVRATVSKTLSLPEERLDDEMSWADFGYDSITLGELGKALTDLLQVEIAPSLFFSYSSIKKFCAYLVQEKGAVLRNRQKVSQTRQPAVVTSAALGLRPALTKSPAHVSLKRKIRGVRMIAPADDKVAIIGMSGRYAQANNLREYWNNLAEGRNSIVEVPLSRWDVNRYYDPDPSKKDKTNSKWLGLMDDVDCFDPLFFRISPQEARYIDPHHRLFLQESYKAFEDAGYSSNNLGSTKCGVYLGISTNEYAMLLSKDGVLGAPVTSNHSAIAAARISYYLNLKGPALSIDTACSSSLVAIHLACQGLLNRETDMALAGGVALCLNPEFYVSSSQAGMFSSVGQCKTFDDSADGIVVGDGVGAVVLKRLKDAEADNDFIYGVILGSGINQDGRTNGITAPNVNSQIELERAVYDKYKIDPDSISYVEAHGTGTKLGDPIELDALATVFKEKTARKNFCALGSVKSNIGHTTAAAGVAGVQKVLLSMQHRTLVPTLNVTKETSRFDFKNSPFYISQERHAWDVAPGSMRRAAVSSFGFSGTNAHLVIEEHSPSFVQAVPSENTNLVVPLSARTVEQLRQKSQDLLEFIRTSKPADLAAVAYTLQVGREAMEERLGFVVSSIEQLMEKLEAYLAGQQGIEDVYQGAVKRNKEALSLFSGDADLQQTLDKWIANRKVSKLLELWVKGLGVDWSKLYGEIKPQRMSLPAYPFAKERYWIDPVAGGQTAANGAANTAVLHPLLHCNTSDLNEQRYSSTFTGEEFFLADHQAMANGHADYKVLPEVAYLEMARAAIEQAWSAKPESAALELHNTVWAPPAIVAERTRVSIALLADDKEQIDYEIYSQDAGQEIVHCQGRAVWSREPAPARLGVERLKTQMRQGHMDPSAVYAAVAQSGLVYGPAFQAITAIHLGNGEVLAQLRLPATVADKSADFVLHPSLMDGAMQACVVLMEGVSGGSRQSRSSFALDWLRMVSPCTPEMMAWVRYSSGSQVGDTTVKIDIDLCDGQGNICVQMRGVSWQQVLEKAEPVIHPDINVTALATPAVRKEIALVRQNQAAPAPVERKKRIGISLAAAVSRENSGRPLSAGKPPITLASPAESALSSLAGSASADVSSSSSSSSSCRLFDCGNGIFSIEIAGSVSSNPAMKDMMADLLQGMARAQQEKSIKVLTLRGIERCLLPVEGNSTTRRLSRICIRRWCRFRTR